MIVVYWSGGGDDDDEGIVEYCVVVVVGVGVFYELFWYVGVGFDVVFLRFVFVLVMVR